MQAALQLQLQESRAAGERAGAEAQQAARRAGEAEAAAEQLRRQLEGALAQHDVAHAAVEGAADQLQVRPAAVLACRWPLACCQPAAVVPTCTLCGAPLKAAALCCHTKHINNHAESIANR